MDMHNCIVENDALILMLPCTQDIYSLKLCHSVHHIFCFFFLLSSRIPYSCDWCTSNTTSPHTIGWLVTFIDRVVILYIATFSSRQSLIVSCGGKEQYYYKYNFHIFRFLKYVEVRSISSQYILLLLHFPSTRLFRKN